MVLTWFCSVIVMFGDGNWYFLVAWCYIVFGDVFCVVVECFQLCFGMGNVGFTSWYLLVWYWNVAGIVWTCAWEVLCNIAGMV